MRIILGVLFPVFAAIGYSLSTNEADYDLWGHVRFGMDILRERALPQGDPYSWINEGVTWINHEWLAEVLMGGSYQIAGVAGLIALRWTVIILLYALLYRSLRGAELSPLHASLTLLLLSMQIAIGVRVIRPQIFTYLFFALTLWTLKHGETRPRLLLLQPLWFVLWVNLHGGVLAGVGVVVLWAAAHAVLAALGRRKPDALSLRWVAFAASSTFAVLLHPQGWHLFEFLVRTATVPRPDITEWAPIRAASLEGVLYFAPLAAVALVLYLSPRVEFTPLLLVLIALLALPLTAIRHLPLAAIAMAMIGAPIWGPLWNRLINRKDDGSPPSTLFCALGVIGGLALIGLAVPQFRGIVHDVKSGNSNVPARFVSWLKDQHQTGRMANYFNYGEYLIWHLGPDWKVSYDGRRETVYPRDLRHLNEHFMHGVGPWDELLARKPDLVLMPINSPTHNLMRHQPGWVIVYEDAECFVAVPSGSAWETRIRSAEFDQSIPANGARLYFPE